MPDRQNVIRAIEIHLDTNRDCEGCAYDNGEECFKKVVADALALLREQEAVDAIRDGESCGKGEFRAWWYACGNCHGVIDYKDSYCRHCGKAVKWDD